MTQKAGNHSIAVYIGTKISNHPKVPYFRKCLKNEKLNKYDAKWSWGSLQGTTDLL